MESGPVQSGSGGAQPRGGGTRTLTLTLAQALNDTRALSILDPFTVTVLDTAAGLQALTATQIADLSSSGVTMLEASDVDVAFTTAQKKALGAAGIALEQPYSGGTVEVINYFASGVLESAEYLGIVDEASTSYTVDYGTNGEPTSAYYSNGMTATWSTILMGATPSPIKMRLISGTLRLERLKPLGKLSVAKQLALSVVNCNVALAGC